MVLIAFHSNQLGLYGTEVAMYDYCRHNEEVLGNQSLVVYPRSSPANEASVVAKFERICPVYPYETRTGLDGELKARSVDLLYAIKAGHNDGFLSRYCPTMVHAVFPQDQRAIHGSSYAFVSEWLSETFSNWQIPAVPHVVETLGCLNSLRVSLGIPVHAFVVGCYGSTGSFNIEFAKSSVLSAVSMRSDAWFVFMNIPPFAKHERIIFLQGSSDQLAKSMFVNTCDAMIHARWEGETFGLACAEFSSCNKPIIAYSAPAARHHMWVLGNAMYLYNNEVDLTGLLLRFDKAWLIEKRFDAYSLRYTPERVMEAFDRYLIHPCRSVTCVELATTVFTAKAENKINSLHAYCRKLIKKVLMSLSIIK